MSEPLAGPPWRAPDDVLLDQLANALRPRPLTPPPARVSALRRAVEKQRRRAGPKRLVGRLTAMAGRARHTGASAVVLGAVAVGGTGMALAANRSVPPPPQTTRPDPGILIPWTALPPGGLEGPAAPTLQISPQRTPPRPESIRPPRESGPVAMRAASPARVAPASDLSGPDSSQTPGTRRLWPAAAPLAGAGRGPSLPPASRSPVDPAPGDCRCAGPTTSSGGPSRASSPPGTTAEWFRPFR